MSINIVPCRRKLEQHFYQSLALSKCLSMSINVYHYCLNVYQCLSLLSKCLSTLSLVHVQGRLLIRRWTNDKYKCHRCAIITQIDCSQQNWKVTFGGLTFNKHHLTKVHTKQWSNTQRRRTFFLPGLEWVRDEGRWRHQIPGLSGGLSGPSGAQAYIIPPDHPQIL